MAGETLLSAEAPAPDTGIVERQEVEAPPAAPAAPAAAPAPSVTFDKVVAADGTLAENWRSLLPENLRGEKCLDSIKNFGVLAQSYVHGQRAIGANKLAIPGENATPEEVDAFQKALGRPDTAADYQIEPPKDLPEGMVFSEKNLSAFKEYAFKHGWPQDVVAGAVEFQAELLKQELQAHEAALEAESSATESKLKAEYGENYEAVLAQCEKAVDVFGMRQVLKNNCLLSNYDVIKMLAKVGGSLSESKLKEPAATVQGSAQERYNDLYGNPESAYWKRDHPGHAAAVTEVTQLVKILGQKNPGQ